MKLFGIFTMIVALTAGTLISEGQTKKGAEKKMKKALFVLTNHNKLGDTGRQTGWYLPEVAHPYFVLANAGFEIDFASPDGGKTEPDEKSINLQDADNKRFYEDKSLMAKTENTLNPQNLKAEDYDVIFYAGGHGTMWDFAENTALSNLAAQIYERGGIVAAVCHGPAGLVNIRLSNGKYLIEGKTVNSFTNEEEAAVSLTEVVPFLLESKLIERDAKFVKADKFQKYVAVSERLVTGQNPMSAAAVGEAIVRLANTKSSTAVKN